MNTGVPTFCHYGSRIAELATALSYYDPSGAVVPRLLDPSRQRPVVIVSALSSIEW